MDGEKTKIETYKEVDVYYGHNDGRIYFNFEGTERRVNYLFEARQVIDEPRWEPCDLKGFFVDGTFSDYIGKAMAVRKNTKNGKPEWKYKGRFDMVYKMPTFGSGEQVFPYNKENAQVFKEYETQRTVVTNEEYKLKGIIKKLA